METFPTVPESFKSFSGIAAPLLPFSSRARTRAHYARARKHARTNAHIPAGRRSLWRVCEWAAEESEREREREVEREQWRREQESRVPARPRREGQSHRERNWKERDRKGKKANPMDFFAGVRPLLFCYVLINGILITLQTKEGECENFSCAVWVSVRQWNTRAMRSHRATNFGVRRKLHLPPTLKCCCRSKFFEESIF